MEKYKLTEETVVWWGHTLHRIECVTPFATIKQGEKGGWIEKEYNLSQDGDCWVCDNAKVYGNSIVSGDAVVGDNAAVCDNAIIFNDAKVFDDAKVGGNAVISGNVKVRGNVVISGNVKVRDDAVICDNAVVSGNAKVYGNAHIGGDAVVKDISDYHVFKNNWSSGRFFTWTLYKTGRFGLPEREIQRSTDKKL